MTEIQAKQKVLDGEQNMFEIIDEIYDDFESRTCGKCRYEHKITMSGSARSCTLLEIAIGKDFGCNKWKSFRSYRKPCNTRGNVKEHWIYP